MCASAGRPNASVLPLPVAAMPMRSCVRRRPAECGKGLPRGPACVAHPGWGGVESRMKSPGRAQVGDRMPLQGKGAQMGGGEGASAEGRRL
eukprot:208170-Chlamydomonas_euryale.AAC.3